MKTRTLCMAIALPMAMALSGMAAAGEPGTTQDKVLMLDTDGDGQLSLAEYTAQGDKTEADFAKIDVNGDGYASATEMEVGKERGTTAGERKDTRAKAYPVPTTNPKSEITDD